MFGFQHLADKLDQSDLNHELTLYAEMTQANLESEDNLQEARKYPAAVNLISILNSANLLNAENRQLFIDLLFACKTITMHKNSGEQFAKLSDILTLLHSQQLLTNAIASKLFGDITALNALTETHQALHAQHALTEDNVQAIFNKNNRFSKSM